MSRVKVPESPFGNNQGELRALIAPHYVCDEFVAATNMHIWSKNVDDAIYPPSTNLYRYGNEWEPSPQIFHHNMHFESVNNGSYVDITLDGLALMTLPNIIQCKKGHS